MSHPAFLLPPPGTAELPARELVALRAPRLAAHWHAPAPAPAAAANPWALPHNASVLLHAFVQK